MPPKLRNANAYTPRDTTLGIAKITDIMGFKSSSGFQGSAFIILQVIRACNLAVLLAVIFVSGIMMFFAKMPNGFQFFNDVSLAFVIAVAGLLFWTELPIKMGKAMINRNWPAIGEDRGFTWLGIAMILMGCHHLGALSNDTYNNEDVPFQVWQAIMASGIIAIAFGVTNVIASLVFSNRASGVHAREVRNNGATTRDVNFTEEYDSYRSNSIRKEKAKSRFSIFNRGNSKPKISHPITHDVEYGACDDQLPIDDRSSPIIPDVKRPPTALHPAYNAGSRSSRYSEASHLDRFGENRI
ncbi:hypothetical protein F5Y00DRAFT_228671 [Daldinia vernicosa]|uniref:uncharacterized protein n=1 Tax=Daldinia vernicosa TaxID=114800 RepID=UPI0020079D46|nr:uncharacterized protein F5Y00DRAFT_228671 [Daldinia vernicosa]KAI0852108.1 hypothetical protein F5Y00DRAFT_228671 [Daldinia vernicosa]